MGHQDSNLAKDLAWKQNFRFLSQHLSNVEDVHHPPHTSKTARQIHARFNTMWG